MNRRLIHLPEKKKDELKRVVSAIREELFDTEMVILYGSYARGDFKEAKDLSPERKSGHVSDYDILVVTQNRETALDWRLWVDITSKCDSLGLSAKVRIITHDIDELNLKLSQGQYFYTEIISDGLILYDSGNHSLEKKKKLSREEKKENAEEYFKIWFKNAQEFFDDYRHNLELKRYNKCAFYLHQTTEMAYKTILLVFSNYCPNEHFLRTLGEEASEYNKDLESIFPRETQEDARLFRSFDYAYIGARYDMSFKMTEQELQKTAVHVEKLLDVTEGMSREFIDRL